MLRILVLLAALGAAGLCHARNEGVTPDEIRLGASAVLSGPLGPQTAQYGEGSRLLFDAINAQGGVHGRMIRYTTLDDAFDAQKAVENTRRLLENDKVFMVFNSTGTAQTAAILPLIQEHRTLLFGPVTGASVFRENFNPHVFHVRAGYASEAQKIVSQLRQQGMDRVAVFYQDDGLGKTLLAELKKASAQEKLPFVAEIKVDPKQPDFAAAGQATEKAQPQAVIVATAGTTFTHYIKGVQATSARPTYYGFSVASMDVIQRELKEKSRGIILAQIMPSLRSTTVPVVAEYLALLRAKSPGAQPSASQFEGFVHARLLVEGLRRAGRNLSTESFTRAMEEAGEISFGRFNVKYSPKNHNGSTYVELAIVDAEGSLRY
ncbi:ABC transporter substrate-binding protein [Acidovorax sp.]|uniref:ABC transporter substrate-binding protein n=1 Tax=Acidovorax sp. TaxID=1872122 RepID=UPI002ACE5461|nr:ABC transporter substrate-binding protein [Acidovorax sp.]MDZ7865314.1 ABC transporter substrate-binding protein [Acidovorax sp.]